MQINYITTVRPKQR